MKLTKEQVIGIVRHTLTFVGGIVVAQGLADQGVVTEIIGGVMTLATLQYCSYCSKAYERL